MKKILMITYAYPPATRAGTYRSLRFSSYLLDEGWEPVILTLKEKKYEHIDVRLLKNIPSAVKVYRTPALLFFKRYSQFRTALGNFFANFSNSTKTKNYQVDIPGSKENSKKKNSNQIVWRNFFGDILRIPDYAVGWMPFAFIAGLYLIYSRKIDVIYATSGPFTSIITGLWLKKITGKPLIADCRDPWAAGTRWSHPLFVKMALNLEKRVLKCADKIIANTSHIKKQFVADHHIDEQKIVVVNNGFDQNDFKNLNKYHYDKFTISHIGSLASYRNPINFLFALKELLNENEELEDKINVLFVGDGTDGYQETINSMSLQKVVQLMNLVPHNEALSIMSSSHLLLLLQTGSVASQNCIPGKVFEYFATGIPILSIGGGDGALKDLFRDNNVSGKIIDHYSVEDIKEAIKMFYDQHRTGKLEAQPHQLLEQFNSQYLTKLLAEILSSL